MVWLFGALWNAVVSVFFYMAYVAPARKLRLQRHGEASLGRIVAKRTEEGEGSAVYILEYAFVPGRRDARRVVGDETKDKQTVEKREWDDVVEGDEVWVVHWPGRPKPSALYGVGPFVFG